MFGSHWSSASGNLKYLIYHVTLQVHAIEGSGGFLSGSSLYYVTNRRSLVVIGIMVVEMFLFYHVISQDSITKASYIM